MSVLLGLGELSWEEGGGMTGCPWHATPTEPWFAHRTGFHPRDRSNSPPAKNLHRPVRVRLRAVGPGDHGLAGADGDPADPRRGGPGPIRDDGLPASGASAVGGGRVLLGPAGRQRRGPGKGPADAGPAAVDEAVQQRAGARASSWPACCTSSCRWWRPCRSSCSWPSWAECRSARSAGCWPSRWPACWPAAASARRSPCGGRRPSSRWP